MNNNGLMLHKHATLFNFFHAKTTGFTLYSEWTGAWARLVKYSNHARGFKNFP
jgi:hypothetical protein